jgi:transposase
MMSAAEASTRPRIPVVAIKTAEEQDIQALHRIRSQCLRDRTALVNSTRGLLGEYGIIVPKGIASLRKRIPELLEDADNCLNVEFRCLLEQRYAQLIELDILRLLSTATGSKDWARRMTPVGVFKQCRDLAQSLPAHFWERVYRRGRAAIASLGLVPRQHSTGGKNILLGISKR